MRECDIYAVRINIRRREHVTTLRTHTDMNTYLRQEGDTTLIYEVWKGFGIHSRWHFHPYAQRWKRMATPRR